MATHITVVKFGGTSIQDAPAFMRVAQIIGARQSAPLIVVASAMSGVTDALIASFRCVSTHGVDASARMLEEHFARHLEVGQSLSPARLAKLQSLIEIGRSEITDSLKHITSNGKVDLRLHDAIASHGERLAANLLTLVLEEHGMPAEYVDARSCVITNNEHGNAAPLLAELQQKTCTELLPLLNRKRIPVLGGFIGSTTDGVTTTLGRGSSDYSATLIGAAVHAHEIEIWTDVDGIQTADPRLVQATRTVPHISYSEAAQLAKLGAQLCLLPGRSETHQAKQLNRLQLVIAREGGPKRILACGQAVTTVSYQSILAWELDRNVSEVGWLPGHWIRRGKPIVLFSPVGAGWRVRAIHTAPRCHQLDASTPTNR